MMLPALATDTQMPSNVKIGDVIQLFSVNEAVTLGITEFEKDKSNFLYGIPYFHISEFFRMKPDGSLYVMFADCSKNWNAIKTIQSVACSKMRKHCSLKFIYDSFSFCEYFVGQR